MSASAADRSAVADLLGREPAGDFEVVVRHADGSPLVIANAPLLLDGTPMPTRYWLVGEPERRWVGRLEGEGGVARAEAEVDGERLADAHRRYAAERDALVPVGHRGPRPSGGVGGTRTGVKCLHAHYAWFLAGGDDPVGRWVADALAAEGLVAGTGGAGAPAGGPTVAAVDCGTNSTRLLVARRGSDGALVTVERMMRITRLGQGVDATGRLAPEAIDRTVGVLAGYRRVLERHGATRVRASATSAARDAANRDAFFAAAAEALGAPLELLPGEEEGRLSFAGATADVSGSVGDVLVFDIGGGSTEVVRGSIGVAGQRVVGAVESIDMGCVRVTERFLRSDPPSAHEIEAASSALADAVGRALARVGARSADLHIGLAGTVSTLAAVDLGLDVYDHDRIHHHLLASASVDAITARLAELPAAGRAGVAGVEPGRAEVIVGGCLVLQAVLRATGAGELLVSEADILDGLAASMFP